MHQQIGLLGGMENYSQKDSLVHAINNFFCIAYFWNLEQFLRICDFSGIIEDYDRAVAKMNRGKAIPVKLTGGDWNDMVLDKSGALLGFKFLVKWDEKDMATIRKKQRLNGFLDELTTLA